MLHVLATGQSNLQGRYPEGDRERSLVPRLEVWNSSGAQNPGSPGDAWVAPDFSSGPFSGDNNNFPIWFCHRLAIEQNDDVRLVMVARGGREIEEWLEDDPDEGHEPMFVRMQDFYDESGAPPADILLWHQGESDTGLTKSAYKTAWNSVESRIRGDGNLLASGAPIIVGGLTPLAGQGHITEALEELADENANVYYASSEGLLGEPGDEVHFAGPELVTLGRIRYWNAYAQHIGWTPPAPREVAGEIGLSLAL